ncbi:MAG TPA: ribosome maturation factor RimP [Firmicutes bacterium]|uniref:Ribosome maturation factor RimP n=1 Tax=Capillibacterium thermochitinicola TaxID=2699427 RepID=A0A8J6LMK3_9FIRM|nr:ribosome maturation factor RimP [Capillibacterium thermochitinicola]MBA2133849.1 ribosome maturation factor RimP [Capillibacterium thermochitinicola]HHW11644.1 ribosome maturation factor RimP [Bacillota bacterium]
MGQGLKEILWKLAEKVGAELNYEVVDVELTREGAQRLLRVFIDRPEGIGINDCEMFSKRLSAVLDEEDPIPTAYLLEVSSPGLERPLTKPEHFQRFAGQGVEISLFAPLQGKRKIRGRLKGWSAQPESQVSVEVNGVTLDIPWEMIAKARLQIID